MSRGLSKTQQKILLLLAGWFALGMTKSYYQHKKIIRHIKKEWHNINEKNLNRTINKLYKSKLIDKKINRNGTISLKLTDQGKAKVLTFSIEKMKIKKMERWDGKWRLVLFDIPESKKRLRDLLRNSLKNIGFHEFQKSAFICPNKCEDEVNFLIEYYDLRKYVRFIVAKQIDNEPHLKQIFKIN
jgi:phenylacetic acid degradation operon negative regulatory protein